MNKSDREIRKRISDWYTKNATTPKYHIQENIKHCQIARIKIIDLLLAEIKKHPALNKKMQKTIEMIVTEEPRDEVKYLINSLIGDIRVAINEKFF